MAVDPHSFFADPDLAVFFNADPDPAAFLKRKKLCTKLPYEELALIENNNKDCSKVKKNMKLVKNFL